MNSTKQARLKSAIKRLTQFKKWFITTPREENIDLGRWLRADNDDDAGGVLPKNASYRTIITCGATACLGGWLVLSPMYRTYREENGLSTKYDVVKELRTRIDFHLKTMHRFVGSDLMPADMVVSDMFAGSEFGHLSSREEAIRRLNGRIGELEVGIA